MFTVFSTYVEVILNTVSDDLKRYGILHVCGGDPSQPLQVLLNRSVFSTYVEVILIAQAYGVTPDGILHVCGGDPHIDITRLQKFAVFSTYVEVILTVITGFYTTRGYSPRMWR